MQDLVVVGAGPAGTAIAAAAARLGLEVTQVAPDPTAPWTNNYGAWRDELAAAGFEDAVAAEWPRARVRFGPGDEVRIDRPYVRVDNPRLQARLHAEGQDRLRVVEGRVRRVEHHVRGARLELESGPALEGRVVVDATGVGALLEPVADPGPVAAQVAFGVELACEHGFAPDEMLFMDFSPLAEDDAGPWPTFLYAMPFGPGRVFVEETVLVARPAPKIETLEARLGQRLERRGLADAPRVGAVERCFIPMGGPLPRGPQPVVPFGAAAGMVHPATGYQLTRALGLARPLAQSLARGLRGAPDRPAVAAELGWETVWPASRRRIWEVYRFGMELLLSFDSEDTRTFFRSFFDLDPNTWARYLDGAGEGRDVAAAMAGVFARLPWRVRTQIMAHSLGRPGFALLHAMSNL